MSTPTPTPRKPFDPNRNDFRRKLGYYLTGLAIGLILLGILQMAKRAAVNAPASPPANGQTAK